MNNDTKSNAKLLLQSRRSRFEPLENAFSNEKRLVEAWTEYLEQRICTDWVSYLMTFQFKPIRGGEPFRNATMRGVIAQFHERLVCSAIRRPKSPTWREHHPKLFAFPDYVGSKLKKENKEWRGAAHNINDTVHYHGILQLSPKGRVTDLVKHLRDKREVYLRPAELLLPIYAAEITFSPDRPARYVLAPMLTSRFEYDDLIVLG